MADDTQGIAPDGIADAAQIADAIRALQSKDLRRLRVSGRLLSRPNTRTAFGWTADDLLQEAILRTYEGNRRWRPERVDFVRHLTEAMRSIASQWRRQGQPPGEHGAVDVGALPDNRPSPVAEADEQEEAAAEMARLQTQFQDDEHATYILWGIEEGQDRAGIMEKAGMTLKHYDAARKRLTRAALKSKPRGGGP